MPAMNFLPFREIEKQKRRKLWTMLGFMVAVVAWSMVFLHHHLETKLSGLQNNYDALKNDIDVLSDTHMPRAAHTEFQFNIAGCLDAVVLQTPATVRFTQLQYVDQTWHLNGASKNKNDFHLFLENIESLPCISKVKLNQLKVQNRLHFTVALKEK